MDYAAPLLGCKYVQGPNFNSTTHISILSVAYLFGKKRRLLKNIFIFKDSVLNTNSKVLIELTIWCLIWQQNILKGE
jgi:hypothetical protein